MMDAIFGFVLFFPKLLVLTRFVWLSYLGA